MMHWHEHVRNLWDKKRGAAEANCNAKLQAKRTHLDNLVISPATQPRRQKKKKKNLCSFELLIWVLTFGFDLCLVLELLYLICWARMIQCYIYWLGFAVLKFCCFFFEESFVVKLILYFFNIISVCYFCSFFIV